uniref:Uncharacterized protein n=1 Tax=Nelumbo nucifera TaxID=4432 RepID=A0A822XW17_NELNU|nr:TPA_asm: hypothetical protein HUJ06_024659 [Nelumbo nucifera]
MLIGCFELKALNEAFEVFCNKQIAGISSAEIFAIFCDRILKKGAEIQFKQSNLKNQNS